MWLLIWPMIFWLEFRMMKAELTPKRIKKVLKAKYRFFIFCEIVLRFLKLQGFTAVFIFLMIPSLGAKRWTQAIFSQSPSTRMRSMEFPASVSCSKDMGAVHLPNSPTSYRQTRFFFFFPSWRGRLMAVFGTTSDVWGRRKPRKWPKKHRLHRLCLRMQPQGSPLRSLHLACMVWRPHCHWKAPKIDKAITKCLSNCRFVISLIFLFVALLSECFFGMPTAGVFELCHTVDRSWPGKCLGAYICAMANPQNLPELMSPGRWTKVFVKGKKPMWLNIVHWILLIAWFST